MAIVIQAFQLRLNIIVINVSATLFIQSNIQMNIERPMNLWHHSVPLCTISFHASETFQDLFVLFGIDISKGTAAAMHETVLFDWM